jgi:Lon protease-like protein
MFETITINFQKPIPLFPLETCILLPHSVAPLHIFEDRYRRLAEDILDSDGLVVMALFERKPSEEEYLHGQPTLRPFGCLGYVEHYDRLPDGRYLVLLQGVCRVRLEEELISEPYRTARVSPHGLADAEDQVLLHQRAYLSEILANKKLPQLEHVQNVYHIMERQIPTAALVDLLSTFVFEDTESIYGLLEEENPAVRAELLIDRIQFLVDILPLQNLNSDDEDDPADDQPWDGRDA